MKHLIEVIGVKTLPKAINFYNLNLGVFLIENILPASLSLTKVSVTIIPKQVNRKFVIDKFIIFFDISVHPLSLDRI